MKNVGFITISVCLIIAACFLPSCALKVSSAAEGEIAETSAEAEDGITETPAAENSREPLISDATETCETAETPEDKPANMHGYEIIGSWLVKWNDRYTRADRRNAPADKVKKLEEFVSRFIGAYGAPLYESVLLYGAEPVKERIDLGDVKDYAAKFEGEDAIDKTIEYIFSKQEFPDLYGGSGIPFIAFFLDDDGNDFLFCNYYCIDHIARDENGEFKLIETICSFGSD